MANYMDREDVLIYLTRLLFESDLDKGGVLAAITKLPTANVAPRAEVAREIFAEIKACFAKSEALPETVGLVDFIKFAELRKKYESEVEE